MLDHRGAGSAPVGLAPAIKAPIVNKRIGEIAGGGAPREVDARVVRIGARLHRKDERRLVKKIAIYPVRPDASEPTRSNGAKSLLGIVEDGLASGGPRAGGNTPWHAVEFVELKDRRRVARQELKGADAV